LLRILEGEAEAGSFDDTVINAVAEMALGFSVEDGLPPTASQLKDTSDQLEQVRVGVHLQLGVHQAAMDGAVEDFLSAVALRMGADWSNTARIMLRVNEFCSDSGAKTQELKIVCLACDMYVAMAEMDSLCASKTLVLDAPQIDRCQRYGRLRRDMSEELQAHLGVGTDLIYTGESPGGIEAINICNSFTLRYAGYSVYVVSFLTHQICIKLEVWVKFAKGDPENYCVPWFGEGELRDMDNFDELVGVFEATLKKVPGAQLGAAVTQGKEYLRLLNMMSDLFGRKVELPPLQNIFEDLVLTKMTGIIMRTMLKEPGTVDVREIVRVELREAKVLMNLPDAVDYAAFLPKCLSDKISDVVAAKRTNR
jgi:hypothetical protein